MKKRRDNPCNRCQVSTDSLSVFRRSALRPYAYCRERELNTNVGKPAKPKGKSPNRKTRKGRAIARLSRLGACPSDIGIKCLSFGNWL